MARVLVVDDDRRLAELVASVLSREGYETEVAVDGQDALRRAAVRPPDVILLDYELPDMNALEVMEALRARPGSSTIPVVILTGGRLTPQDEVVTLRTGAVDYIRKGTNLEVMRARIDKAIAHTASDPPKAGVIEVGCLQVNVSAARVYVCGREVDLENRQLGVLIYLASRPGVVVSRSELLEKVWGTTYAGFQHAVDQTIYQIRKRLGDGVSIRTVPRRGYRLGE